MTSQCKPVQSAVSEVLSWIPQRLRDLTDEEWDAQDQAVAEHRKREAELVERQRLEKRRDILRSMGASGPAHMDPEPQWSQAMELVAKRVKPAHRGLFVLAGPPGRGKSFAAVQWLLTADGRPWYATGQQLADKDQRTPDWNARCYVLDQVGHEWRSARFDQFVDHVYRQRAVLVMTTDLGQDDIVERGRVVHQGFKNRYGEHLASRIREFRGWLPVDGKDWRR